MYKKRLLNTILGAGLAISVGSAASAEGGRMVFATQEAGSSYHTLGTGFSTMLTDKLGRKVTVQPFGGSAVYLPLIDNGEAHLAFISSLDGGAAYSERGLKKLRAVARIMPFRVAFMARADSGINTAADMAGKKVVVDFRAMASMGKVTRAMLAAGGLSEDDVDSVTMGGVGDGNKALIEGNVDVTFIAVGIPLVAQAHSAVPGGVRYVDMSGPEATNATLAEEASGVYLAKLDPSPNMPEVAEPVTVVAFDTFLITGADTPEKDVQAVLAAVKTNFGDLQNDYPALKRGKADLFSSPTNSIPYHPGAVAYYEANGNWTAENEDHEKSFGD